MRATKLSAREEITLRPFAPSDARAVSEVICRCLVEVNLKDYGAEAVAGMLPGVAPDKLLERFGGTQPIVALRGRDVVGIGLLAGNEIRTMFVEPSFQGRGIGRHILRHLE